MKKNVYNIDLTYERRPEFQVINNVLQNKILKKSANMCPLAGCEFNQKLNLNLSN